MNYEKGSSSKRCDVTLNLLLYYACSVKFDRSKCRLPFLTIVLREGPYFSVFCELY